MTNVVHLNLQRKRFEITGVIFDLIKQQYEKLEEEELKLTNMQLALRKQAKRCQHRHRLLWNVVYDKMGVSRDLRLRIDPIPAKDSYTLIVED